MASENDPEPAPFHRDREWKWVADVPQRLLAGLA
jgi:hypothetical protein